MRYAFFSDVHGNLAGLESVLCDIDAHGVDRVICLGDVVGYGPEPAACVELVRERCDRVVLGNHDAMVAFDLGMEIRRKDVAGGLELARAQLSERDLAFLRDLPVVVTMDGMELTHASLYRPAAFEYIDCVEQAARHLKCQKQVLSFVGHTHVPLAYMKQGMGRTRRLPLRGAMMRPQKGRKYVVNVGSVGQPRDRDPRASWVLWDASVGEVSWHRVGYDVDTVALSILAAGLPEVSAARLLVGR